jgi:hypothetical protein
MLKGFLSTAEIDEQIIQFTNQRLIELNNSNIEVQDTEFSTPEFNSKDISILI